MQHLISFTIYIPLSYPCLCVCILLVFTYLLLIAFAYDMQAISLDIISSQTCPSLLHRLTMCVSITGISWYDISPEHSRSLCALVCRTCRDIFNMKIWKETLLPPINLQRIAIDLWTFIIYCL